MGFGLGLRFFWTVNQPPWIPGCLEAAERWLGGATLSRSTPATGGWLNTAANDLVSMVRSHNSNSLSLISNVANRLHLLHVPLALKEAEK